MRVFITGATGFIGQHLAARIAKEGHELVCLVRRGSRVSALERLGARLIYGDVTDGLTLRAGMEGCDWLFHLANLYSMWEPDPYRFHQVNIDGTRIVLETALAVRMKKVVYVSTAAVYGRPAQTPFHEDCPPGPVTFSEYARTKAAANEIAWQMYEKMNLPLVVLYPGIVLGAGDDKASGRYIQDIVGRRVPGTIFHQSYATYVYVGDVVEALIRAAEIQGTVGSKYLIGRFTLDGKTFVDMIRQVSQAPLPVFRFPDWLVMAAAHLLTGAAAITHRAPLWGLSIDAARTLKHGFSLDGSKAERELGIRYTPIQLALEEAIASYRRSDPLIPSSLGPSPKSETPGQRPDQQSKPA